jgi:hypothetical protein
MAALSGRHVSRSRPDQEWSYRFNIMGRTFKGRTNTSNRAEAEKVAEQIYRKAKVTKARTERLSRLNIIIERLGNELQASRAERAQLRSNPKANAAPWLEPLLFLSRSKSKRTAMVTDKEEIERLTRELRNTRYDLISMAPAEFYRTLVKGPQRKVSYNEWRMTTISAVIDHFDSLKGTAPCPLCGGKQDNGDNFRRTRFLTHMKGRNGVVSECPVLETAFQLHKKL